MRLFSDHPDHDLEGDGPSLERDPVEVALVGLGVLVLVVAIFAQVLLTSGISEAREAARESVAESADGPRAEPINLQSRSHLAAAQDMRERPERSARWQIDPAIEFILRERSPRLNRVVLRAVCEEIENLPWSEACNVGAEELRVRVMERIDLIRLGSPAVINGVDASLAP